VVRFTARLALDSRRFERDACRLRRDHQQVLRLVGEIGPTVAGYITLQEMHRAGSSS
jgi:hypothetical protein